MSRLLKLIFINLLGVMIPLFTSSGLMAFDLKKLPTELAELEDLHHINPIEAFNKSSQLCPKFEKESRSLAYCSLLMAKAQLTLGKSLEAINILEPIYNSSTVGSMKMLRPLVTSWLAEAYELNGQKLKSLRYHKVAVELLKDSKDYWLLGQVYLKLAWYNSRTENLWNANETINKSLNYAIKSKNETLYYEVLNALGDISAAGENEDRKIKAAEYLHKALSYFEEKNYFYSAGSAAYNLGTVYRTLEDYEKSVTYYEKCRIYSVRIGDASGEAYALNGKGYSMVKIAKAKSELSQGASHPALVSLLKAKKIFKKLKNNAFLEVALSNLFSGYITFDLTQEALNILPQYEAMVKKSGSLWGLQVLYYDKFLLFKKMKKIDKALINLEKSYSYFKSHVAEQDVKSLNKFSVKMNLKEKEFSNSLLTKENLLQKATLEKTYLQRFFLGLALLLTIVIGVLIIGVRNRGHAIKILREEARTNLEQQAKEHFYSEFKKVIYPHQMQRIKYGAKIESTMPVGESNAAVIAFDIQSSSRLGHSENYEFFTAFLKECDKTMTANYDREESNAKAYMIREMGDGFLCSVGFPYSTEGEACDDALSLAHAFIKNFNDVVSKYFPHKDVYCGVGISYGPIRGYFPRIGLIQYNLYGDAIVHATRYESMRKHLFQNGVPAGNIIIIQETAYQRLSEDSKKNLLSFDLGSHKVRDDSKAKSLYYILP